MGVGEQSLHKMFNKEDLSTSVLKTVCEQLDITLVQFFDHHSAASQKGSSVNDPAAQYDKKDDCVHVRSKLEIYEIQNASLREAVSALKASIEMLDRNEKVVSTHKKTKKDS